MRGAMPAPPQYVCMAWCSVKAQGLLYGLDDRGFGSQQGKGIFIFITESRTALRPTQPPIRWVPGALSLG
jgi:hypothetical protein